ncbi:MAG TPA: hypothetical protein VFM46_15840, partial [Pseudomonadales bacterium]|nr:hypothetical protein [Pseudomonadales bacterium]
CFEWMTFTFVSESRSISLDQMMSFICVSSFYVLHTATQRSRAATNGWLILLFISGFLIRGPIGVILPNAVLASYFFAHKRVKDFFLWSVVAAFLIAALWGLQLGLAWYQGGNDFVANVIRMQVTERMSLEDYQPFYYYFTSSIGNFAPTFPLFILVCGALITQRRRLTNAPHFTLLLSLLLWVLLIIGGLSVPHTKKVRYLMPMLPALCAVLAYPFGFNLFPRLLVFLSACIRFFPGFLLLLLIYAKHAAAAKGIELADTLNLTLILLGVLQAGLLLFWLHPTLRLHRIPASLMGAAFASWLTWSVLAAPSLAKMHDTQTFVSAAEQLRAQQPAPLLFYRIGKDGMAIKYMVNLDHAEMPYFAQTPEALQNLPRPLYLLVEQGKEHSLGDAILTSARLIHRGGFDKTELLLYRLEN